MDPIPDGRAGWRTSIDLQNDHIRLLEWRARGTDPPLLYRINKISIEVDWEAGALRLPRGTVDVLVGKYGQMETL